MKHYKIAWIINDSTKPPGIWCAKRVGPGHDTLSTAWLNVQHRAGVAWGTTLGEPWVHLQRQSSLGVCIQDTDLDLQEGTIGGRRRLIATSQITHLKRTDAGRQTTYDGCVAFARFRARLFLNLKNKKGGACQRAVKKFRTKSIFVSPPRVLGQMTMCQEPWEK